jgi:predicted AAA+ superfamily ATPase
VDFDDVRLSDFETRNFHDLQDLVIEFHEKEFENSTHRQIYYFFDEIQNIPLWEKWLNNLYRRGKRYLLQVQIYSFSALRFLPF